MFGVSDSATRKPETRLLTHAESTISLVWKMKRGFDATLVGSLPELSTRSCGIVKATVTDAVTVATCYWIRVMIRFADTMRVPPAPGVMVNAGELKKGLRTVSVELTLVVCTRAIPTIWLVPVARPTTV